MPTHVYNCAVCGKQSGCCEDEHALGIPGDAGCVPEFPTESGWMNSYGFCSLECFDKMAKEMAERRKIYIEVTLSP